MIYIWRTKVIDLGFFTNRCDQCAQERRCRVDMVYSCFGPGGIFNVATGKQYYVHCTGCGQTTDGDPAVIEGEFASAAVPVMDRFGCVILIGGILSVACLLTMLRR